ncbi:DNA replication terminus site-binding protein [uncultured Pseudomonas sp.]|uniref:DNA replication terminus site-binding protein n=1 Tax=uncultured Pseudomonas sp. TaxID=114707 RepID=UPI0025F6832C|nr:DNA replication terminus site-binding protein [uncultured Pseudomonas sp.]
MYEDIKSAFENLQASIVAFNALWPSRVVAARVWRLPLLAQQRVPDLIEVEAFEGSSAVELTQEALLAFHLQPGQAPGTVSRLPGYIALSEPLMAEILAINACKHAFSAAIEQTRLELELAPEARPRIMRKALGGAFNTKQLIRKVHGFPDPVRQLTFTWAGHTAGGERVTVAKVREQLKTLALARADREHTALDRTPEWQEHQALIRMADDDILVRHKKIAPHPRAMLWFGEESRYDAMIHANLPVFVVPAQDGMQVVDLRDFDRTQRGALRPDIKPRREVLATRLLYLPTDNPERPATQRNNEATLKRSTYSR